MAKTKNQATNIDQFYEYCRTNNRLAEEDVDNLLILAAINNNEITDTTVRGYLPIAWAACVRIAEAMQASGVAKYVDQFTEPMVHLPFDDRQGLWKSD